MIEDRKDAMKEALEGIIKAVEPLDDSERASTFIVAVMQRMETAKLHHVNEIYYKELLEKIGKSIGRPARIADDGSEQDEILLAKLPQLVDDIICGRLK